MATGEVAVEVETTPLILVCSILSDMGVEGVEEKYVVFIADIAPPAAAA